MGIKKAWALRRAKARAVDALIEQGVSEAKAERIVYKRITDRDIESHEDVGDVFKQLDEGGFLGGLSKILQWLEDHEEQIKRVVAIILALSAMFG